MSRTDILFVMMPYADVPRPSLGLGLLQAAVKKQGMTSETVYANIRFAEILGLELPNASHLERLLGEWTFSRAAFRSDAPPAVLPQGLFRSNLVPGGADTNDILRDALICVREEVAPNFVNQLAGELVERSPRIVGCSSTFEQHCASLALLRRIKEIDPSVITLMGGANCEAEMGRQAVRSFPWVDFVVSGEADEIIVPLCSALLKEGLDVDVDELPHGVLHAGMQQRQPDIPVPRAVVKNMDSLPIPDYTDYFRALDACSLKESLRPGLLVELSRGCWWGQKHHCTFCGLNGGGMTYRSKDPERALSEMDHLASLHDTPRFMVVDNIMDQKLLRTLLPKLGARDDRYELFFETKSNLRKEQVEVMNDAGVIWIQPGIEAFSDEILELMDKGARALQNIQLLKYTREHGIHTTWLLLHSFPNEDDELHERVATWLPLLFHLQPPKCSAKVLFDRFSLYQRDPERYGLRLRADASYRSIYPLCDDELDEIAYFFADQNDNGKLGPGAAALSRQTVRWWSLYQRNVNPILSQADDGERIHIFDTRPCATRRRHELIGIDADVYRSCDPAGKVETIASRTSWSVSEVAASLERGVEENLILELDGRYLSLAVPGEIPAFCGIPDFPGGGEKPRQALTNAMLSEFRDRMLARAEAGRVRGSL